MKKFAVLAVLALAGAVAPAQAKQPKPIKPHPSTCVAHAVGFKASGSLVSSVLTRLADGRYTGTVVVMVTRANHHAATGAQTYTLVDARVKFHHGVDPLAPAAGSRVKLSGKITVLAKHCSTTGFVSTTTIRKVDIRTALK